MNRLLLLAILVAVLVACGGKTYDERRREELFANCRTLQTEELRYECLKLAIRESE